MRSALVAVVLSLLGFGAMAQPATPASDPEILRLFAEDQADRKAPKIDWSVVAPRDEARRTAARKLLAEGRLRTAEDYRAAAFIFQHGSAPGDYLLAHTLAMVAVAKGDPKALWIAAATLDRYLINTGHQQIYGTQYSKPSAAADWTMEPYDRELIADSLRRELGVPDLAAQQKRLEETKAKFAPAGRP